MWIDLPILSAMEYFQGLLGYFLEFAKKYGSFFGLIGLVWTGIRLVNSRIDLRSAWWDSLSKWFVFILLINFYAAGTSFLSYAVNSIGVNAGSGKTTIINNFVSLRTRIESELKLYDKWVNGLTDLMNEELGINLDYIDTSTNINDYINEVKSSYNFSSKQQKKEFEQKIKDYKAQKPDNENSIWSTQTLEALNSILVIKDPVGDVKTVYTKAYVTDNPQLNIWLLDADGQPTHYLSAAAVFRIGVLTAQILYEKAFMDVTETVNSDGSIDYSIKKTNFSVKNIGNYVMTGLCCLVIIVAFCFALIQYFMCILEYTIVQGIGAAFIPFYLFDGTKDIPKKLLPVFTGFAIKMLVMVICLMFIINMFLVYAAEQISPTSGSMSWIVFGECFFICLIAFVLTGNAPKIAMTLLTGQPQLSMGEFMQAAGAIGTTAAAVPNLAGAITSPAMALAKKKAHDWGEQKGARKIAERKQEGSLKSDFATQHGIDTSTRQGRKYLDKEWKNYKKTDDGKAAVKEKTSMAGDAAVRDVKQQQRAEYRRNGGVMGSTGRVLAHYIGGAAHLTQTVMKGKNYNVPISNVNMDRAVENAQLDANDRKITDNKNGVQQDPPPTGIGGSRIQS